MKPQDFQRSPISLEKGALFLADVHYQKGVREDFEPFLHKLVRTPPPQLFLMGDIFDLLVPQVGSTLTENRNLIALLNALSKRCKIIYLEGNHDFNLKPIFASILVVPRSYQPLVVRADEKRVALLHGDLFSGKAYEIYTALIRNPWLLKILDRLDKPLSIAKKIQNYNATKDLCGRKVDLAQRKEELLKRFGVDMVIEGHFHQDTIAPDYINLPSFACGGKYLRYDGARWIEEEFLE